MGKMASSYVYNNFINLFLYYFLSLRYYVSCDDSDHVLDLLFSHLAYQMQISLKIGHQSNGKRFIQQNISFVKAVTGFVCYKHMYSI